MPVNKVVFEGETLIDVSDSTVSEDNMLAGTVGYNAAGERKVGRVEGVTVYTHTKSGTVHEFTGTGANGRALMTADVQAGDTFTVNGTSVAAYMGANDASDSMVGSPWNGKWVSFIVDGGAINFKGEGNASDNRFLPGQIMYSPIRVGYGDADVNSERYPWVNADDDLDKTVYADLYAKIGDTLSEDAAQGFFNCKRLTGRFPVAAGGNFTAGEQGGAASHTLTQEELPRIPPLKVYHSGGTGSNYFSRPLGVNGGGGSTTISRVTTNIVNTGYADLTVNLGGRSQPFQTIPPYVALYVHVHT